MLANDTDADGDTLTISAFDAASANGGTVADNLDGTYTYTPPAGFFGTDSFTYTVSDGQGGSDTATVSVEVNAPAGAGNLVLHLETISGVDSSAGTVTGWNDLSGYGNDLTAIGDPSFVTAQTPSGQAAIALDGTGDALQRLTTLNNLPGGASDRTMFFVVDYASTAAFAGLVYGDGAGNEAFGAILRPNNTYTLQGWGNTNDFSSPVRGLGDGVGNDEYVVQSITLSGNNFRHFINGVEIDSGTHVFNTDISAEGSISIGEEIAGAGFITLNMSAALIYDIALSESDRLSVETYLQETYLDPAAPATQTGTNSSEYLFGTSANDTIDGGGGSDIIAGGAGVDSLTGGTGNDIFDFNYTSDTETGSSDRDIITDFTTGSDRIDVSDFAAFTVVSASGTAGNGAADFSAGATAEIAWEQSGGVTLVLLDTNGDGTTDHEIELSTLTTLATADFIV